MQKETENQTKQFFLKKVKNMKKLTIIFLVAALVLSLAGCKPLPVTPTNVTNTDAPSTQSVVTSAQPEESVVSEPQPTTQPEESRVAQEDSKPASKPESSKSEPIESKTSSISTNSPKPVAFQNWTWETIDDYCWNIGGWSSPDWNRPGIDLAEFKQIPFITLLRSRNELAAFLKTYGIHEAFAAAYTEQYFATHDLILFKAYNAYGGIEWYADQLSMYEDTLQVSLFRDEPDGCGLAVFFCQIYPIEVEQKLENVQTIRCTTTRRVCKHLQDGSIEYTQTGEEETVEYILQ